MYRVGEHTWSGLRMHMGWCEDTHGVLGGHKGQQESADGVGTMQEEGCEPSLPVLCLQHN